MNATTSDQAVTYRPDIDGLRAISVIAVVLFHTFPATAPLGFLGVDVFFVISGYVITRLITKEIAAGQFSFAGFYNRRIRRIFPALLIVIAATYAAGWWLLVPADFERLGRHVLGAALFLSNIQFWTEAGYFDIASETKPLLHLWSLAVEEQFYLIWPVILIAAHALRRNALIICCAILTASLGAYLYLGRVDPSGAFYLPWARFWELMFGALCASLGRLSHKLWVQTIGLVLIATALFGVGSDDSGHIMPRILAVLGAAAVVSGGPDRIASAILNNRPMVAVGLISYPLYLWHWPIISYLHIQFGKNLPASWLAVVVATSIALAFLTYWVIERPIRHGDRIPQPSRYLAAGLALVGGVGAATYVNSGIPSRLPSPLRPIIGERVNLADGARVFKCWLPAAAPADGFDDECMPSSDGTKSALWVWGDSYAARLYVGISKTLGDRFQIGQISRDACPPVAEIGYANCQASNEATIRAIEIARPHTVVLFAQWPLHGTASKTDPLYEKLHNTLERLHRAGIERLLVVGPTVDWNDDLPRIILRKWRSSLGEKVPDRDSEDLKPGLRQIEANVRSSVPVFATFVSMLDLLCDREGCLTVVPGLTPTLMSPDYGHFTEAGAVYVTSSATFQSAVGAKH